MHFWSSRELIRELELAGCRIVDSFTYTYFNRIPRDKALLHGISEDAYLNNPISQGVVCKNSQ